MLIWQTGGRAKHGIALSILYPKMVNWKSIQSKYNWQPYSFKHVIIWLHISVHRFVCPCVWHEEWIQGRLISSMHTELSINVCVCVCLYVCVCIYVAVSMKSLCVSVCEFSMFKYEKSKPKTPFSLIWGRFCGKRRTVQKF